MKLLFSETLPDYKNYVFPYAVWATPEAGETPHRFFERGFLPAAKEMDRYYLCRSLRVALAEFAPSSENRRVLRKCEGVTSRIVAQADFELTDEWRDFCLTYADIKFGKGVMTATRLSNVVHSKLTNHFLLFRDEAANRDVGLVTLFLQPPHVAQYYFAFYDLNYYRKNLGMYMMTSAVKYFAENGFNYVYLGTCYTRNALYKTQFAGAEFFNGAFWSRNLKELKYLIARTQQPQTQHLFETEEYVHRFYDGDLGQLVERSVFRMPPQ